MKKRVLWMLVLCITAGIVILQHTSDTYACPECDARFALGGVLLADVNDDGLVNAIDIAILRAYLIGRMPEFPSGERGKVAADIDRDGDINSLDFAYLRRFLTGKGPLPYPTSTPSPSTNIIVESGFEFDLDTGTIVKYIGDDDIVTIPNIIEGIKVNAIGDSAFCSRSNIQKVTIPKGITTIGSEAFYSCKKLKIIILPDSIISIGSNAFTECVELSEAIFLGNQP